jgi:phage-related protein
MSEKTEKKLNKVAFWGFIVAGVLGLIAGLRDIFVPGFFSMSPRMPTKIDIIMQLISGVSFFAVAYLFNNINVQNRTSKK